MKIFGYGDVHFTGGLFKNCFDEMADFYRTIDFDSIFQYLRRDAGETAPGKWFGGWYPGGRGSALIAQWTSALCRIYANTGLESDRQRALKLLNEFWRLNDILEAKGDPIYDAHSFYAAEKMLVALCDANDLLGVCLEERARFLVEIGLNRLKCEKKFGDNGTEWYTVSEAYYRAADTFKLDAALTVAKRYEYTEFWDLFANNKDPYSLRPRAGMWSEFCHAYSHTNSFNGCAEAYLHTGDRFYLDAITAFYDFMQREQVMCTGGYGSQWEHLMPKDRIINALRTNHDSFETQCDTYAAYRISEKLTCLTGEARFSDWVEKLMYNATLASVPMTSDGKVIYYSDYNMFDAFKLLRQAPWTCCTGTRPLVVAEMLRLAYFYDAGGVYVAQYLPSELKSALYNLSIDTEFPYKDSAEITVNTEGEFALYLRKPKWLSGEPELFVNGEALAPSIERDWLRIKRVWRIGDKVSVTLPQNVYIDALDKRLGGPIAFMHGPLALAAEYDGGRKTISAGTVMDFVNRLVQTAPLHYDISGTDELDGKSLDYIHFKPFLEFKENEHYSLYFDNIQNAEDIHRIF